MSFEFDGIKFGICHWSLPIDGPYACKLASELGFDGVQLDIGSYKKGYPLSRKSVQQVYLELAEQYKISFPSIAVRVTDDYSMVSPTDTDDSKIVMDAIRRSVEVAADMSIKTVMIPSFQASDIKTDKEFNQAVEVLTYACDYASLRGITIATENLLSVEKMQKMVEEVNRPNFKLYFDTQNYFLNKGYDTPEMLEKLADLLCNEIHVKDGREGIISSALLGKGDSSFYHSIDVIKNIKFSGWINIENYYDEKPLSLLNDEPIELIKNDLETLKKALL